MRMTSMDIQNGYGPYSRPYKTIVHICIVRSPFQNHFRRPTAVLPGGGEALERGNGAAERGREVHAGAYAVVVSGAQFVKKVFRRFPGVGMALSVAFGAEQHHRAEPGISLHGPAQTGSERPAYPAEGAVVGKGNIGHETESPVSAITARLVVIHAVFSSTAQVPKIEKPPAPEGCRRLQASPASWCGEKFLATWGLLSSAPAARVQMPANYQKAEALAVTVMRPDGAGKFRKRKKPAQVAPGPGLLYEG